MVNILIMSIYKLLFMKMLIVTGYNLIKKLQ